MRMAGFGAAFETTEPVLSACLDVSRDGENAGNQLDLRWQALREELTEAGAPAAAVERAGELLTQGTGLAGSWGRVVAVTAERTLVDRVFPGRPRAHGRWGTLPHLMPVIEAASATIPYALVVADRTGADITVSARAGDWSESVDGGDF